MFKFNEIPPLQPTRRSTTSTSRFERGGRAVFVGAGLAAAVVGLLLASNAHASGGPYVVDDADVIGRGTCQLESFYSRLGSGTDLAFLAPGCNVANVEWTLGLTRARLDGETDSGVELQGKYLIRPISTGGVGLAVAAGIGRGLSSGGRLSNGFVNLPVTWEPVEALRLHANVGSAYSRDEGRYTTTYGVGFDWALGERLNLLGENFRDDRGSNGYQVGLRPVMVPGRLHLDVTWARELEGIASDWWTVGLVWAF
jgi:hypothetical protein